MVSDLLQLSRLHAGTRLTSSEPVVIGDVLSDALASADAVAQTRGVTLSGAAPDGLVLYADPRESRGCSTIWSATRSGTLAPADRSRCRSGESGPRR